MFRRALIGLMLSTLVYGVILFPYPVLAEPLSAETQQILEQSLSIVELDREIGKISDQQARSETELQQIQQEMLRIQRTLNSTQAITDQRVRAYYMGEREELIGTLFTANNLRDFISILDYIDLIFGQDQEILTRHQSAYRALKKAQSKQQQSSSELLELKNRLVQQRNRVEALHKKVDASVENSGDPEKMRLFIQEMNAYWENIGLYEVRRHFKALAAAMVDLPEFLKNNGQSISASGGTYTIAIKQEDLNQFLRSKDEIFNQFAFTFTEGKIIAEGTRDSLNIRVEGHYTVENQPENSIVFHVDQLVFNGMVLPDTTCRELEEDFDLGFYPKKIIPLVEATDVTLQKGILLIHLKLSL
ncbi:hypothetical protein J2Z69_000220 [Paenibacillus shirakamiensis]|uniref:Peptidoglycan hydrolase PcsB coiled-coil domain-containing protein n=1 Tax=Paenibacillus shirakamiensis TaxID=1265935 RepID=A0ABS4JDL5_9BACL|nr:hypothetical protein [Paenibacillus shirakamiensis]MBP1999201.1 hypothetical protein [Paenibacillus shirakamiensis]